MHRAGADRRTEKKPAARAGWNPAAGSVRYAVWGEEAVRTQAALTLSATLAMMAAKRAPVTKTKKAVIIEGS
jgi:hypothetical protein